MLSKSIPPWCTKVNRIQISCNEKVFIPFIIWYTKHIVKVRRGKSGYISSVADYWCRRPNCFGYNSCVCIYKWKITYENSTFKYRKESIL